MTEQLIWQSRPKRVSASEYQRYLEQLRSAYTGIKRRQKATQDLETKEKKQAEEQLQQHLLSL